jgi:hypothetical protein
MVTWEICMSAIMGWIAPGLTEPEICPDPGVARI